MRNWASLEEFLEEAPKLDKLISKNSILINPLYRRKLRDKARKEILNRLKTSLSCVDCGGNFPAVAMDWDHIEKTSEKWKPSRLHKTTLVRAGEELKVCELRCANCHRVKTHKNGDHLQ